MQSQEIGALAAALAKAQGEISNAKKDSENPFFHSSYANLASIWEACRIPLSKNGLSVSQIPTVTGDGKRVLETILMHSSGQWISGIFPIEPVKQDPQNVKACVTYMRRAALEGIVGIAAGDDDDGEAASGRPGNSKPPPSPKPTVQAPSKPKEPTPTPLKPPSQADYPKNPGWEKEPCTENQRKKLWAMAQEVELDEVALRDWVFQETGKTHTKDLTKAEIQVLFDKIAPPTRVNP